MSKERLETAKLMARMLRVETRLPYDFPFDLVDWLVEQAERVQELESDSYNAHLERLLDRKEQEIERYQKSIKECLERMNKGGAGTRAFVYETLKKSIGELREMNEICTTCNGSGGIDIFEDSIGEIVTIPCPDCGGSGEATDVTRKALEESK